MSKVDGDFSLETKELTTRPSAGCHRRLGKFPRVGNRRDDDDESVWFPRGNCICARSTTRRL